MWDVSKKYKGSYNRKLRKLYLVGDSFLDRIPNMLPDRGECQRLNIQISTFITEKMESI